MVLINVCIVPSFRMYECQNVLTIHFGKIKCIRHHQFLPLLPLKLVSPLRLRRSFSSRAKAAASCDLRQAEQAGYQFNEVSVGWTWGRGKALYDLSYLYNAGFGYHHDASFVISYTLIGPMHNQRVRAKASQANEVLNLKIIYSKLGYT